jgi:hypothetical protein
MGIYVVELWEDVMDAVGMGVADVSVGAVVVLAEAVHCRDHQRDL